jgi:integrase
MDRTHPQAVGGVSPTVSWTKGLAPATCNHYIKLIRSAYNKAIEWEIVEKNPAAGLKLFREDNQVDHHLSDEELGRLLHVLHTDSNRAVCNVCLFLLATGARKSEALQARWEHIDEEARLWRIPMANTKARKVRSVPLNDTALSVLKSLPGRSRGEWLFISSRGERLSGDQQGLAEAAQGRGPASSTYPRSASSSGIDADQLGSHAVRGPGSARPQQPCGDAALCTSVDGIHAGSGEHDRRRPEACQQQQSHLNPI